MSNVHKLIRMYGMAMPSDIGLTVMYATCKDVRSIKEADPMFAGFVRVSVNRVGIWQWIQRPVAHKRRYR